MYNITQLKNDLEGVLHGTTNNQITNLDGLINRAARQLLLDIDPQENIRLVDLAGPVFTNVWDYPLPVDVKGNGVIDIRPQVNRTVGDIALQSYNQAFDTTKQGLQPEFTIQFNSSIKSIRINNPYLSPGILLNDAATLSGNGSWSTGGGAQNLSVDNQNWVINGGALQFDLAAGQSTGYVENSTMQAQDLSASLNQATQFLYTLFPLASAVTAVELRFGSSSTDYYARTVSVTQQNTVFQNGWNLLAYLWAGITPVGSPDPSNITYVRVTYTYDGTLQTGLHLNDIVSNLGRVLEIEYYSKYLFRDVATGAYQETVTDDTNLINLDVESFNLLFNYVAYLAVQQQQGLDANFHDGPFFEKLYTEGVARYKGLYKSQRQKPHQTYYQQVNNNYGRYLGRWGYWGG